MHVLSLSNFLPLWEAGASQSTPRRALLVLNAACPEVSRAALGQLPTGQRDDLLLQVRAATFGPVIEAAAACPECEERLELTFTTDQLRQQAPIEPMAEFSFALSDYALHARVPTSTDLEEISDLGDTDLAESTLLRRCLLSATRHGKQVNPEELPGDVIEALGERMAEADPQADSEVSLTCPACDHRWSEPFDIAGFFWREIESAAVRLMRDVHTLATAYRWSEPDILNLTPGRRRFYLDLIAESSE